MINEVLAVCVTVCTSEQNFLPQKVYGWIYHVNGSKIGHVTTPYLG